MLIWFGTVPTVTSPHHEDAKSTLLWNGWLKFTSPSFTFTILCWCASLAYCLLQCHDGWVKYTVVIQFKVLLHIQGKSTDKVNGMAWMLASFVNAACIGACRVQHRATLFFYLGKEPWVLCCFMWYLLLMYKVWNCAVSYTRCSRTQPMYIQYRSPQVGNTLHKEIWGRHKGQRATSSTYKYCKLFSCSCKCASEESGNLITSPPSKASFMFLLKMKAQEAQVSASRNTPM